MNNLLIEIIKLVRDYPGKTGREYARLLRGRGFDYITKSDVNHLLYGYSSYFSANPNEHYVPAWEVKPGAFELISTDQKPVSESTPKTGRKPTEIRPAPAGSSGDGGATGGKKFFPKHNNDFVLKYDDSLELYKWQADAFGYWKANNYQAIIQAVTGSGKTRLALAAIDSFIQHGRSIEEKWKVLIVVPTKVLMDQWNESINESLNVLLRRDYRIGFLGNGNKQGMKYVDILIGISNSVSKFEALPDNTKALIIGDECQHYGTENSTNILDPRFICRLGLTAYLERVTDNGVEDIIIPYFGAHDYHYGYSDAIEDNVIAPFEITFVIAQMTDSEKVEMDDLNNQIRKLNKKIVGKYPHLKDASNDEFWMTLNSLTGRDLDVRRYVNTIYKRRGNVVRLKSKLNVFNQIHPLVKKSKGTFGFTQLSETAKSVSGILQRHNVECEVLDGQTNSTKRDNIFRRFENHGLDMIIAPKLLDEGVNVPQANLAIITGRNHSMRQTIQRVGRVVRRKDDAGKGYIIIIASKDTIEDPDNIEQDAFYEVFNDPMIKINKFEFPAQIKEMGEHFNKWKL